MDEITEIAEIQNDIPSAMATGSAFHNMAAFKDAQRISQCLAASEMVPKQYQKNVPNCMIAMELAHRIGASVFAVMQHLYVVQGKPAWEAKFIIAALNSSGLFSPLRFHMEGKAMTRSCYAWAREKATNEKLDGPVVDMEMAKNEGWLGKPGSKWKTMPELMLRYRAAAFFGRLYAPHVTMGMQSSQEVLDAGVKEVKGERVNEDLAAKVEQGKKVKDSGNTPKKGD